MPEMDYKEIEEEKEKWHFAYLLENDFGDIYLLQTDPSGRVVYNRWFLFNKHECSERKLANAISIIHKTVDPIDEEKIVLDAISACRPVMKKLKKMSVW
jgi:hypothetical protein